VPDQTDLFLTGKRIARLRARNYVECLGLKVNLRRSQWAAQGRAISRRDFRLEFWTELVCVGTSSEKEQELKTIRTLSLFSGAGGLDIGFHQAGYEIRAAVEIEAAYAATLAANGTIEGYFGHNVDVHCEDIRSFDPAPYVSHNIDCIIGGPPCQTFSAAGRRSGGVLGMDDERGQLFLAYIRILEVIQPKVFVFENVYGLPGANGGGPWQEIVNGFKGAGYTLKYEVLDAADYGAPQHRERVIMVGYREGSFAFPLPTHGPDAINNSLPLVSARDAISDLHEGPGGLYGHLLPLIPEGMNYSYFTREMGHPEPQFAWRSKFHDFLYKASPDGPVRTIKSKPGKFTGPFHWKNRHFSADELKRLQSFPDNYNVVGTYNKVLEQIGNSVPPALAYAVANAVRIQLLDGQASATFTPRPDNFKSSFRQRQRARSAIFQDQAKQAIDMLPAPAVRVANSDVVVEKTFGLFSHGLDRNFSPEPHAQLPGQRQYEVTSTQKGKEVTLTVNPVVPAGTSRKRPGHVEIHIRGLEKYLDEVDHVEVLANIETASELVSLWVIIERELVRRTRFFTLIDIYGHYANRGDSVTVSTVLSHFDTTEDVDIIEAINLFGNTEGAGRAVTADQLKTSGVRMTEKLQAALRIMRWDIRTQETHPTLGSGAILCTYPFPSISAKAQFSVMQTRDLA
jgi:DNA (cytosine-5)-methyltransferase 1